MSVAGIELDGTTEMLHATLELSGHHQQPTEHRMCVRIVLVAKDCMARMAKPFAKGPGQILGESPEHTHQAGRGEACVRASRRRLAFDRGREKLLGRGNVVARKAIQVPHAAMIQAPAIEVGN